MPLSTRQRPTSGISPFPIACKGRRAWGAPRTAILNCILASGTRGTLHSRIGGDSPLRCGVCGVQTRTACTTSHLNSRKFREMADLCKSQRVTARQRRQWGGGSRPTSGTPSKRQSSAAGRYSNILVVLWPMATTTHQPSSAISRGHEFPMVGAAKGNIAGLDVQYEQTKNQFPKKIVGVPHFRDRH